MRQKKRFKIISNRGKIKKINYKINFWIKFELKKY